MLYNFAKLFKDSALHKGVVNTLGNALLGAGKVARYFELPETVVSGVIEEGLRTGIPQFNRKINQMIRIGQMNEPLYHGYSPERYTTPGNPNPTFSNNVPNRQGPTINPTFTNNVGVPKGYTPNALFTSNSIPVPANKSEPLNKIVDKYAGGNKASQPKLINAGDKVITYLGGKTMNFPETPNDQVLVGRNNYKEVVNIARGLPQSRMAGKNTESSILQLGFKPANVRGGNKKSQFTSNSDDKFLPNLVDITEPPMSIYRGEKTVSSNRNNYKDAVSLMNTLPQSRLTTMLTKKRNTSKMQYKTEI